MLVPGPGGRGGSVEVVERSSYRSTLLARVGARGGEAAD